MSTVVRLAGSRVPRERLAFTGATSQQHEPQESKALFDAAVEHFDSRPPQNKKSAVGANVPRLFSVLNTADRLTTSQTAHYASARVGFRTQPAVKHRIKYESFATGLADSLNIHATPGRVVILGPAGENTAAHHLVSINSETGVATEFDIDTQGLVPTKTPRHSVATDKGFAFTFRASDGSMPTQFVTNFDAQNNKVLWSHPLFTDRAMAVDFLHATPSGDIVVLYGAKRHSAETMNTHLCRLNGKTGAVKFDVACPWPNEVVKNYVSTHYGEASGPQIFFYDEASETAVAGLFSAKDKETVHFYSINFTTGAFERLGEQKLSTHFLACPISNGEVLFLPSPERRTVEKALRCTFGRDYFRFTDFDADAVMTAYTPLVSNTKQAHAVRKGEKDLSFYSIGHDGMALTQSWPHEDAVDNGGALSPGNRIAMTADGVVYFSTALNRKSKNRLNCRLYAFDANTQEVLWYVDEIFKNRAVVIVNDDGRITWLDENHAVILGK